MKKKMIIINLLMSVMVLSAMLFQTVHSYEHFLKQLTEKSCHHHTTENKQEITHSHDNDSQCHICHFSFSTYIPSTFQSVVFQKTAVYVASVFGYCKTVSTSFKGSLFALRAPPTLD
ncbi:hypothetical protein [Flavobacterium foetidum]|uniref:hypothetical protein n=1 Tax=Flavobacterium foetidum TaxID=2026681 RepID=UPI001074A8AE|nr:hypothetical protein [Flavobacterium foetidum]KAF2506600.1 hypothetical protein E0W73_21145 [Flavobacterium foetidum]